MLGILTDPTMNSGSEGFFPSPGAPTGCGFGFGFGFGLGAARDVLASHPMLSMHCPELLSCSGRAVSFGARQTKEGDGFAGRIDDAGARGALEEKLVVNSGARVGQTTRRKKP